jgi:hypothetical protein
VSRASRTAIVCGLGVLSAAAAGADPFDERSLRISAGVVRPEDLGSAAWFGIGVRARFLGLCLEPEVGYWSRSETAFALRSSVRDLHAGVSADWTLLRLGRARLLAAAGGSAHVVTSSGGPSGGATASETRVRAGPHASLAFELRIGERTAAFVGARSDWIVRRSSDDEQESRFYGGIRLAF